MKAISACFGLFLFAATLTGCSCTFVDKKVVENMIEEYEMVSRNGDKGEQCSKAGLIAASYLRLKDETNYAKWSEIKKKDCQAFLYAQ